MLNQQIKKTIVNALMKVVDSAPTRSNSQYKNLYTSGYSYQPNMAYKQGYTEQYRVSNEKFKIWIDYVFSVLNIADQHIDSSISYSVRQKIQNIMALNSLDNTSKTIEICKIILDYARSIINM